MTFDFYLVPGDLCISSPGLIALGGRSHRDILLVLALSSDVLVGPVTNSGYRIAKFLNCRKMQIEVYYYKPVRSLRHRHKAAAFMIGARGAVINWSGAIELLAGK
jgi:hypothetical protein